MINGQQHQPVKQTYLYCTSSRSAADNRLTSHPLSAATGSTSKMEESEFNITSIAALSGEPGYNQTELNLWSKIPISLVLVMLIVATAIGNTFVIVAVTRDSKLKTTTNKLVASLAVTDLIIGVVVMPMAAAYHVAGSWMFGWVMCDIFVILDVMCCTSSILHLVAIALDRYWTFTDVTYSRGSKLHKYFLPVAITATWLISALICIPGFFGWREEQKDGTCIISQDKFYTIYSTVGAFYLPLVVIIVIYCKIFQVVRNRVRGKSLQRSSLIPSEPPHMHTSDTCQTIETMLAASPSSKNTVGVIAHTQPDHLLDTVNQNTDKIDKGKNGADAETTEEKEIYETRVPSNHRSIHMLLKSMPLLGTSRQGSSEQKHKDKLAARRERKALRTLLIITGAFITCWLPFFLFAAMMPFSAESLEVPLEIVYFVTWLGYFNSMLNPVIYTIFNADFRQAFKKLLCFRASAGK